MFLTSNNENYEILKYAIETLADSVLIELQQIQENYVTQNELLEFQNIF